MSFILGIDTGGTYTDGVIVDSASRKIVSKAKTPTTKQALSIGIEQCINRLDTQKLDQIELVSLSTTLATNAIVEDKGARVGLIFLGAELDDVVPAAKSIKIKGRCDIMGEETEPLDLTEIKTVLGDLHGEIEALAVSAYASVRNPEHEQEVKRLASEILNIPVVCGHELTSALGFHHRTVTAILNGRLIPVIDGLLQSVHNVLDKKQIKAPVLVVKGDGTLMSEIVAREKPVETVLSGPAASVIGGLALTGKKDGIVLDMGGTTTDIANVSDGHVKIKEEGAKVGGWRTRVRAAEISTFGLGGDSKVYLDAKGQIQVGPHRVWPLCMIGADYPELIDEMKSFKRLGERHIFSSQEADCFLYLGGNSKVSLEPWQEKILDLLQAGPHSLTHLARAIGQDPETIDLTSLVDVGVLGRISVTPTDILHVQGKYNLWNRDMAHAGVEILAKRMGVPIFKFVRSVEERINKEMAISCIQSAADFSGKELSFSESEEAMFLIHEALAPESTSLLVPKFSLKKPIVAIGAPAGAWVKEAGKMLNTEVVIPDDADVANAFGAAVGQITECIEIQITLHGKQYILNTPWSREVYDTKEEAVFYAIHEGRKFIEHRLRNAGCSRWKIVESTEEQTLNMKEGVPASYTGTKMRITGVGVTI